MLRSNAAFRWDMSVNAAYVGTQTTRGFANIELNVSPPGGGEQGRIFVAEFGRTASTTLFGGWNRGKYHSMQLQLTRPFKNGLLLRGAYTLGKTLNMTDDDGTSGFDYNAPEVFERNYALAGFDRLHTFTMAYSYRLPFGSENGNTLLNALHQGLAVERFDRRVFRDAVHRDGEQHGLDQRGNLQTADLVGDVMRLGIGAG